MKITLNQIRTHLNQIRTHSPRHEEWERLLSHLGKTKLSLLTVMESNGLPDALWCLRCLDWNLETQRKIAALMVAFVKPVIVHMNDDRSKNAVVVLESFSNGKASLEELKTAAAAAAAGGSASASANTAAYASAYASASASANTAAYASAYAAHAASAAASAAHIAAENYIYVNYVATYASVHAPVHAAHAQKITRKNQEGSFASWMIGNEK